MYVLRNWRAWILLLLFVGPIAAYAALGALWLKEQGWLLWAALTWVASGIVFAILAEVWTKSSRTLLPPLDWDSPATFSPHDRAAWALVTDESERGDAVPLETLTDFDIYINTGRSLARKLADHYHPGAADPIDQVPVIEVLTALELAAEDLNRLCRQVPGGDLVTPGHWKQAVKAAGYLQRANDIYTYLLPLFQPVNGLVRLGAQSLMVKPAWKNMQQNLLRWFFRAFVNRLGVHLIELYSGRLSIGADRYRRLTRRGGPAVVEAAIESGATPKLAVAGAEGSGVERLVAAIDHARAADPVALGKILADAGIEPARAASLRALATVEVPPYKARPGPETARGRSSRRDAIEAAVEADLLVLLIDAGRDSHEADQRFALAWHDWFTQNPALELPPALIVVTGGAKIGGDDPTLGTPAREAALRAFVESLRNRLPAGMGAVLAVEIDNKSPAEVDARLVPPLAQLLPRADRVALIRQLHRASSRSKARRLLDQVGHQGRQAWTHLRDRGRS